MIRCPRCGFREVDSEAAKQRVTAFLAGVPALHRVAYERLFKSIRLMSNGHDTSTDELSFLERLAYERIPSRTALEVIEQLKQDGKYWEKLKFSIDRKLPYFVESVVNIVKHSRREVARHSH